MTLKLLVVCSVVLVLGFAAERGDQCVNRKGQISTCTNIHSCKAAVEAVAKANGGKIYATGEICGYDTETLVCCQTVADFVKLSNTNSQANKTGLESSTDQNIESSDLDIFTNLTVLTDIATTATPVVPLVSNSVESDSSSSSGLIALAATQFDFRALETTVVSSDTTDATVALNILPATSNFRKNVTTPDIPASITETSILIKRTTPVSVKKVLPDRHTCGFESTSRQQDGSQIANIDEFPWVALLRYRDGYGYDVGFRCTGTLINDKYVITAAHCVLPGPELLYLDSVRLGEWLISSPSDCMFNYYREECADKAVDVGVKNKVPHPQYEPHCEKNDIALVRMDRQIDYTAFIRPICLPVQNLSAPSPGTILTTSGWGTTKYGYFLDVKSKVHLPVLNKYECFNRIWSYTRVYDDQICIGKLNPTDVCTADSGGPLMAVDKDDNKSQWYLEGIMSTGYGCNRENSFGVYTRATDHVEWILKVLSENL